MAEYQCGGIRPAKEGVVHFVTVHKVRQWSLACGEILRLEIVCVTCNSLFGLLFSGRSSLIGNIRVTGLSSLGAVLVSTLR